MKDEFYENLASTCESVINDPHNCITSIQPFLKHKDDITMLALYKVFSNIIPLYKIKIKEDKVQHKKEYIKLHTFEQNLYHFYKTYIKTINTIETITSYRIGVNLLALDHFNFTDVIIEKVFRGCNKKETQQLCVNAIVNKLMEDTVGEVTFKIILLMLEFRWCDAVYEGIGNINVINKLTAEDIKPAKEEKKEKEVLDANGKKILRNKKKMERGKIRSKADKKTDKEMAKIERELKMKKEKEVEEATKKMLAKIVDNTMRIYFIILDEKKTSLYGYCYKGLANYKRFIAFEFREGLYMYLNENVLQSEHDTRLKCIEAILSIFGNENFEFKSTLLGLFELLTPLKYDFSDEQISTLTEYLRTMLIEKRQTTKTVNAFVIRLIQFLAVRRAEGLQRLVNRIISSYKIDMYDFEIVHDAIYNIDNDNFESNGTLPFFGGSILNKII